MTGGLRVNDYFYQATPFPSVGETFDIISGVLRYANGDSKLELRDAGDLLVGGATLSTLTPALSYLESGDTTDALVAAGLTRPAASVITLDVSCTPAARLSCPATVDIGVGEQFVASR